MNRIFVFIYGVICYAAFFFSFLYATGFVGSSAVLKDINSGFEVSLTEALLINLVLLGHFAVQHTVIARPA